MANHELPEQILERIFNAVVGTFEQAGEPLPARRVWGVEAAAVDCEALHVLYNQLYKGLPGDDPNTPQRCQSARTMAVTVQIWRCAPQPKDPRQPVTEAAKTEFTKRILRDSWLLLDASEQIDAEGWGSGVIADVAPSEPSEYVASILNLVVPV